MKHVLLILSWEDEYMQNSPKLAYIGMHDSVPNLIYAGDPKDYNTETNVRYPGITQIILFRKDVVVANMLSSDLDSNSAAKMIKLIDEVEDCDES